MPSSQALPAPDLISPAEHNTVHSVQSTLRVLFAVVPIVAGLDKFANFIAVWSAYLNPMVLRIVPVSSDTFMHIVGVVEITAGLLVLLKPR